MDRGFDEGGVFCDVVWAVCDVIELGVEDL